MVKINEAFIREFVKKHNVNIISEKTTGDKKKALILEHCPFNENHKGTESALIIRPNGTVGFECKHDSCKKKKIRNFIEFYEPKFDFGSAAPVKELKTEPPKIQCVANVEKKSVQYLIEPYIPKQNITALVGDGGVGKTFVWVDIASAITNGVLPAVMGIPFENKATTIARPGIPIAGVEADPENHRVLYFTSEDGTDITLKERFEEAGADQNNLFFVDLDDENFHNITLDSKQLEECVAQVRPALCVLDPIQSFVKGKMGERNNMRRQMDCLTRLAKTYDTSFLIVVHTNKSTTTDARTKVSDSSDIWDKCRSVLFVGKTKGNATRYLSQEKGNYLNAGNDIGTQLFNIKDTKIVNTGTTDKKYFDFATESMFVRDTSVKDTAKEFIISSLQDKEMPVKDLDESAKAYGISKPTLDRAKSELKKDKRVKYRMSSQGKGKGVIWYISLNPISNDGIE